MPGVAAIAPLLGYDFLKLAVIQYYNDSERLTPLAGITIRHGFSDVIRQLPDGQPGVAEARDAGELLWLSKHTSATFLVATTPAVIQEHTTAYLRKKVPANARVEDQSLAILNVYERACTIGVPPSARRHPADRLFRDVRARGGALARPPCREGGSPPGGQPPGRDQHAAAASEGPPGPDAGARAHAEADGERK
ncbi:MAG: hypothetical protein IPF66_23520 [Holophagales bacterium]|nr:hypothetical protein [Holophagales bacterium]